MSNSGQNLHGDPGPVVHFIFGCITITGIRAALLAPDDAPSDEKTKKKIK
jgi:hypothetical protein